MKHWDGKFSSRNNLILKSKNTFWSTFRKVSFYRELASVNTFFVWSAGRPINFGLYICDVCLIDDDLNTFDKEENLLSGHFF